VSIFDRKKEPSRDDIAARLNAYVSQPFQAVPAPPPQEPAGEDTSDATIIAPLDSPSPEPQRAEPAPAAVHQPIHAAAQQPPPAAQQPLAAVQPPPPPRPSPEPIVTTGQFKAQAAAVAGRPFFPARPESLDATGLPRAFILDLIVRVLYQSTELVGATIADRIALPFAGVVGPILESLRHDQELEVKGQRGIGDAGYLYGITEKGARHARDSMERLTYTGPAPVPLSQYIDAVLAQSVRNVVVTQENIRDAFSDLIINDDILDMVGPAINSGSSMFLFGYPGNGKTSIAERITKLMGDSIFVPYAVEVDGAVITVFDAINHTPIEENGPDGQPVKPTWDTRWVKIERPVVMVGGELTMASLDLLYNDIGKYYEAPLQMKANGGMFLIDDFGRQMIRPQDLLNRWIVPLEKRVDFLNLVTGKKLSIPFEQLIVFSTNLDPGDLVDDAFLRRIKFKINVVDPDISQFKAIFQFMCDRRGVPFDENMFQYMLDRYYKPKNRPLRMCHPRDIIDQIIAIAKYKMVPARMTESLIDRACETYFVSIGG